MGRYFQTADYKPTIDFLYEPDWALTERVLKTEQDSLDAQREQIEAWKNLQIEHLGGAADAENSKRILDYIRNVADEYSNAIESDKLDARAYTPNLKNFQNELLKNYREGDIAKIQSSPAALRAWEKEHEKFKESHPEYYAHARQKFLNDYHSSGGNSLVRGWQGQALARPIDVEKVTQHAYKLMAEKTGWTRDTTDGTWINSNGKKVESLEANRVFQNIMSTILADPANQAFMRQSTELGWMRYLDDKGNVDYKSPGLNPYASLAESISYKHDQTDHSMRADDYGKMNFQHELDKKMENHKSNLRRKEEKEKWERENPVDTGITTIESDTAYKNLTDAFAQLNSGTDAQKQAARTNLYSYFGEEMAKLGFDINGKDKTYFKGFMNKVIKNGGLIDGSMSKTIEHYTNTDWKGTYFNASQMETLSKEYNEKTDKIVNSINDINERYKKGKIDKKQHEKLIAAEKQKHKELSDNYTRIVEGKKQIGRDHRQGGSNMSYTLQSTKGVNNIDYSGINSESFKTRTTNTTQLQTVSLDPKTAEHVGMLLTANKNSIKALDEKTGEYVDVNDILTKGKIRQVTAGATASGESLIDVQNTDGTISKYKVNIGNPNVERIVGRIIINSTKGRNIDPAVAIQMTPQGRNLMNYVTAVAKSEGEQGYGVHYTTSIGTNTPIAIITKGKKAKVFDVSNGKRPTLNTQNDIANMYKSIKNTREFDNPQEALYSTIEY